MECGKKEVLKKEQPEEGIFLNLCKSKKKLLKRKNPR